MAGGNSHQKAVTKALEKRIEDRVIETVSRILGAAAPVEKEVPWYERGLFWGVFSTAITLVLMVIAAESKDIRWLLFAAWPCAVMAWAVACRPLKVSRWYWRRILLLVLSIVTLAGLWSLYRALPKPEVSDTSKALRNNTDNPALEPAPTKPAKSQEPSGPPFAFTVETMIISWGSGDFIGFWLPAARDQQGCVIEPIDDLLFLRVTNNGPGFRTIINYSLEIKQKGEWSLMNKKELGPSGYLFFTLQGDAVLPPRVPIPFRSNGYSNKYPMLSMPYGNANVRKAGVVQLLSFDLIAGSKNLAPGESIRGWSAFQHQGLPDGDIRMKITDELGKIYTVPQTLMKPGPSDDITQHPILIQSLEDISACRQMADF